MGDIGPWRLADTELEVDPSGAEPFIIPGSGSEHGVGSVDISARIQDTIDEATIRIANVGGEYVGDKRITRGDKLVWRVRLKGESELSERWTGMAIEPEYERVFDSPDEDFYLGWIGLEAEDYVYRTLADRTIHRVFDEEPVEEIIDTLIDLKTSNIDTDIDKTDETATIVANGLNLLEVIEYLAGLADGILYADGTTLVLRSIENLQPEFTVEREDIAMGFSVTENPDDLVNAVRIDGGTAAQLDDSQQDIDAWYKVTDTDRLTTRLSATRSRLDRIEVYTRPVDGSDDDLRVRLQRDDNGSPKEPESPTADIDRMELAPDDGRFQNEGWTAFFLGDHRLHDQDPWLIVDSNREDGQEVAVDSNNNVAFRAYYQYPIISESTDPESAEEYGRVERVITDESIRTTPAARERVEQEIGHNNEPLREVEFEATSIRMRNLMPGDAVTLGPLFEPEGMDGEDWIVAHVNDVYDDGHLRTNVLLRHLDSL